MSDEHTRLYEGLFLINPALIQSNLSRASEMVSDLLARVDADVQSIAKWDERKLAYDVKRAKRGLYMLAYFIVDGRKITSIERDVNLSDNFLRCMILRADHIGETELKLAQEEQTKTQTAASLQTDEDAAAPADEAAEATEAPAKVEAESSDDAAEESTEQPAEA